jgi:serine protease Do
MLSNPPTRRHARIRTLVAALMGIGVLTGCAVGRNVWAAEPQRNTSLEAKPTISQQQVAAKTAPLADLESGFIAINEKMSPSVVSIRVNKTIKTASMFQDFGDMPRGFGFEGSPFGRQMPRQYKVNGAGSGVIVRSDGWIMTNDHVVGDADKVTVKLSDGRELDGTVRRDFRSDIALVKINASGLVPAEMGDSDRVRVGQWAIAFGSPFELDNTMTVGIVSARSREQAIGGRQDARLYTNLLQTDAAINPGNSGGALVDIKGRLVGINVAIESPSGGSVGIGFAIPINTAKEVMDQLITKGKVTRGYLGVGPASLKYDEKQKYGVSSGALITQVKEDSPASRAGLQLGDVATRVNGKPVMDDAGFRDLIARAAPGSKVEITVRRDGRDHTLTATLGTAPDGPVEASPPVQRETAGKLGVRVEALTPDTAKKYNLSAGATGVVIVEVQQGSAAEEAGLQPGAVIMRANGRDVHTPDDLAAAMKNVKSGDSVNLVVMADKARSLVTVKIP